MLLKHNIAGGDFANAGNIASSVKKVISEIVTKLGLKVISGEEGLDRNITGGYTSDLLSDVIGSAREDIDRQPVGDIAGVMIILISANPDIDFLYTHRTDCGEYCFSTAEVRKVLETDYLTDYSLLQDMKTLIKENLAPIGVSE